MSIGDKIKELLKVKPHPMDVEVLERIKEIKMSKMKFNKRFKQIILMCQEARKKYGLDYNVKYKKYIERFSKEIIENKLTEKCQNSYFAEQLCVINGLNWQRKKNMDKDRLKKIKSIERRIHKIEKDISELGLSVYLAEGSLNLMKGPSHDGSNCEPQINNVVYSIDVNGCDGGWW